MKKFISFILMALLPLMASAYDAYVNGIYYSFSGDEATVTYYEDEDLDVGVVPKYSGNVVIPSSVTYNGKTYSVTRIDEYAFANCSGLKSVTIPSSVKSIGDIAFANCSKLTSITIPEGVTSLGSDAFGNCGGLVSVTIKGNLKHLEEATFQGCGKLTTVNLPAGLTRIGLYAFEGCTSLATITIPESVTNIYDGAFEGCTSLTSVTLPSNLAEIESDVFSGCSALTSFTIPEGVEEIGGRAFAGCTSLASVVIPSTVTVIFSDVFRDCSSLADVYCYAENVPGTRGDIFNNTSIASATLHVPTASMTAYRTTAPWSGFGSIVAVDATPSNIIYFADAGVKALCVANWDTDGDGELSETEAAAVTDLVGVFKENKTIATFDELWYFTGLTSIGGNSFRECDGLTSVIIPENVTSIGTAAFFECFSLTSITIPDNVTSIGYEAFGRTGLTSVTIPNSVTNIESNAFYGCESLTSATISNNVTCINKSVFCGCTALTSITLPEGVQEIGQRAFSDCYALTTATIPSTVTSIGSYAFMNCTSMTKIQCYAEIVPETGKLVFDCTPIASAKLEVSPASVDLYKATAPWNGFGRIGVLPIKVDETTFPDANFRRWLHDMSYGKDYRLTEEEIAGVESITMRNYGITNLKGIEYFTALKNLNCSNNKLTALDLSGCPGLETVNCASNQIASLNVSKNALLTSLDCSRNSPLTELDVSQNAAMTSLECSYCALTMLDVSQNTALTSLSCISNKMTMLDVSQNIELASLNCRSNHSITMLDVSQNAALASLNCENCSNLSELYLPKGTTLTSLSCRSNKLTTLDISGISALPSLDCSNNALTSIDISGCTALRSLDCSKNNMTTLNITGYSTLTSLNCSSNKLTSLDMSGWTALTSLNCGSNQLTSLDVSKNTALTTLQCGGNKLTSLGLSNNTALYKLECYNNKLTRLDVSQCTNLHVLYCQRNQIKDAAMDALVESLPALTGDLFVITTEEDWPTEQNVITTKQVAAANAKGWRTYRYEYTWDEYDSYVWEKYAGSRPNEVITYTAGQMATIILPTEPDASKGWYYRLDRVEEGQIIFEEELQPQARVPYIIVPSEDFSIDYGAFDLSGLSADTVSIKDVSFIGSYFSKVLPSLGGDEGGSSYIDIIDKTPDCLIAKLSTEKSVIGALRAYLQVTWDDPYNPGGTKSPQEKMEIVLKDNPNGIETIQNPEFKVQNDRGIFDLLGRKVTTDDSSLFTLPSSLKKGIYIKDGKKLLKR